MRNVARRDTVRLRPNPGQRNGKNLCRPHPETRQSLDPSILRFQERLKLILDELRGREEANAKVPPLIILLDCHRAAIRP